MPGSWAHASLTRLRGNGRRVSAVPRAPQITNHAADLASFIGEVALLRKLRNPHIVEFVGVGSTDTSSEEAKRRTMFLVQGELPDVEGRRAWTRCCSRIARLCAPFAQGA